MREQLFQFLLLGFGGVPRSRDFRSNFLARFGCFFYIRGNLADLFRCQLASRGNSSQFVLELINARFVLGKRSTRRFAIDLAGLAFGAQLVEQLGHFGQLLLFRLEEALRFFNQRVAFTNLGSVLLAFAFRGGDVAAGALDQVGQFIFALTIELDPASVCGNLTLQSLRFRPDIGDLDVDLIQSAPFFGQFGLATIDLAPRGLFRRCNLFDVSPAMREIRLQRGQLFFRVMRFEHAQVGVQSLITSGFPGLTLQRADLPLHFFDHVPDAEQIRFGRFQFAQRLALLRFIFGDAGRFFENRATIFRPRAQDHVDLALLHH